MLTEKEMNEIAEQYISDISSSTSIEIMVRHELTMKKNYGNIYIYNSKQFIETGDFTYALLGNAPFLVEKATGKIVEFGTALPKDYYIKEYEEGRWNPA